MKWMARAVFALLLAVGVVLLLEASSWIAWRLTEGASFSYREAAALRERQLAEPGTAGGEAAPPEAATEDSPPDFQMLPGLRGMVLHPFLGFVYSPEYNLLQERTLRNLAVDDQGFFELREPPPAPSARPLRVGIFGGSLAMVFSFQGMRTLVPGLTPLAGERGVVIESYGMGGYKQPQQLMTLSWLIARGAAPDVVINLDGFNEVVLPRTENLLQGVNPFYPRAWERRVTAVPDARQERLEGEVAYLESRRAEIARSFERPALRWSVSWNFLWRWLDRRAAAEAAEARLRLAAYRPPDRPWVAHGPSYRAGGRAEVVRDLVAVWERSSQAMHDMATAAGLRYYHFLQPNQYVPESKPLAPLELQIAFDPEHLYRQPVIEGYPELREAGRRLAERGVEFHDLTGIFTGERRPVYIDDCCHLNRLGNDLVGEAVVEAILADATGEGTGTGGPAGGEGPAPAGGG